jgi:hypothetical protein
MTPARIATVVLIAMVVVGLGMPAVAQSTPWVAAQTSPANNTTAQSSAASNTTAQPSVANNTTVAQSYQQNYTAQQVSAEINCTTSQVNVTAPADYDYRLTITTLNVSQTHTESKSQTTGPHAGNHSVALGSPSTVYAFVQNQSTGQTDAIAAAVCSSPTESADSSADPINVTVNCTAKEVQITPTDPDLEYGVTIATVTVTETSTQTQRQSARPITGNTTIAVADNAAVYVFVTDANGDVVATARRPCFPLDVASDQSETPS